MRNEYHRANRPFIVLNNPGNYNRLDDADDLDDPFACQDIRGVSIGLDTKEKAVTHFKFVDFTPPPAPFTHIHRWQSVCVRGSETGTKLPKIYINLYLLNLLLNLLLVSGSGWRVFL